MHGGAELRTQRRIRPLRAGKANVAQFELIPWLLGRCATAAEARDLLAESRITDDAFLPGLPPARLHWLLADRGAVLRGRADGGGPAGL